MSQRKLITFDWAIKRLLRSKANFDVLEGFLSELLKDDIRILEVLESESNQDHHAAKFNRVDLKVRNSRDELILIEVQYDREYDYMQRMFYGVAKTAIEHLDVGDTYEHIAKVISINILHFDLGTGQDYIYHGTTRFIGLHTHDELGLSARQKELFKQETVYALFPEYYLIKINRFDDIARDTLDEWIYFLKHEEIKDSFTAKGLRAAQEKLDILKLPPEERAAYERYIDDLRYQASMFRSTYVDGYLDGKKEGQEAAREEGQRQARMAIARQLLDILDDAAIAAKTGLSVDAVAELRRE
ncbi:MAG: Rpn family recombination-promoting nuclease/putative transposase [Methylococcaceae bacterium]|nr:MAG: Rpn family recombination-promoting nuclease/putative transposase [Methylococcaceae bacterium]